MNNQIEIIDVSRETFEEVEWYFHKYYSNLKKYAQQVVWWNTKFNLVSRNQTEAAILEHIRHSLSICICEGFWKAKKIVDAGTGGGLPGIPLSFLNEEAEFLLVDVNQKKITAINQMVYTLEIDRVQTKCEPIESVELDSPSILISKHAFKLNEFFAMKHKTKYDGYYFLKGHDFRSELNDHIMNNYSIKAYNLETGTHLSFFNHKFLLEIFPK